VKKLIVMIFAIVVSFLVISTNSFSSDELLTISPKNPVGQQGSISFILETDKTYHNGNMVQEFAQTLLELPGLGKCILEQSSYAVLFTSSGRKPQSTMASISYLKICLVLRSTPFS